LSESPCFLDKEHDSRQCVGFCFRQEYVVEKKCKRCGEVKSVTEFHKEAARPDGLKHWCKACIKIHNKIYREGHREEIATYQKMYRDKHQKKLAIYGKAHYKKHPEQAKIYQLQRRALKAGASGHATTKQIQARWEYYGNKCYICGKDAEAIDHVIPLSKGGNNWPANLRPICKRCNSSKHAKWPYDFEKARRENGRCRDEE